MPSGIVAFGLIGEYDGSGNMLKETVWLGDLPIAVLMGTGTSAASYYESPDELGSPHVIKNGAGNKVWGWDRAAFGDRAANQNPSGLGVFGYNARFPGQYADAETGLNYNYFRDYNPMLGRYVESDPIGLAGGINTYGYVGGNPLAWTDPWGLQASAACALGPVSCLAGVGFDIITKTATIGAGLWVLNENAEEHNVAEPEKDTSDYGKGCSTPENDPDKFKPVRSRSGKENTDTGEIFEKDRLHKDHYEVYKNGKMYDKGVRDRSVWSDGRPKEKF